MKIRNAYMPRETENGRSFSSPSMTVPGLSYTVTQLVNDYTVENLPPLSRWLYDDLSEEDEKNLTDNMENDTSSDIRPYDRADATDIYSRSRRLLDAVKDRVKKSREFNEKRHRPDEVIPHPGEVLPRE